MNIIFFRPLGVIIGLWIGFSTGVAGFGGAVNGFLIFGLFGYFAGYWIDSLLSAITRPSVEELNEKIAFLESVAEESSLEALQIKSSYEFRRIRKARFRVRIFAQLPLAMVLAFLSMVLVDAYRPLESQIHFWVFVSLLIIALWFVFDTFRAKFMADHNQLTKLEHQAFLLEIKAGEAKKKLSKLTDNN